MKFWEKESPKQVPITTPCEPIRNYNILIVFKDPNQHYFYEKIPLQPSVMRNLIESGDRGFNLISDVVGITVSPQSILYIECVEVDK
jgi:hypothetical protein